MGRPPSGGYEAARVSRTLVTPVPSRAFPVGRRPGSAHRDRVFGENGHTRVTMSTTLNVTGRPAQMGRGVLADVSGKLVERFAANLAEQLSAGCVQGDAAAGDAAAAARNAAAGDAAEQGGTGEAAAGGASASSAPPTSSTSSTASTSVAASTSSGPSATSTSSGPSTPSASSTLSAPVPAAPLRPH